jgi:hypothetical protein
MKSDSSGYIARESVAVANLTSSTQAFGQSLTSCDSLLFATSHCVFFHQALLTIPT